MRVRRTWSMLIISMPSANKTPRMRVWRALKACGAGALRDGVYLLPDSAAARSVFNEHAEDVIGSGGSAHVMTFASGSDAQHDELLKLFDRSDQFAALLGKLHRFRRRDAKLREAQARRAFAVLRREFDLLAAIDFSNGAPHDQVEGALNDAEAAINARFSSDEPHPVSGRVPRRERSRYVGRTWATRERLWIDRVASAWLIRRFVDPKAKFLWLKRPKDCPKTAVGFDFDGAEFSHVGGRVTFEVVVSAFGLSEDHALVRLGTLVHQLDVGGVPVAEAAGFAAIVAGLRARYTNDDELLKNVSPILDALYTNYSETTEGTS
jgi:hypothetical protein